jgi:hypothetical protein
MIGGDFSENGQMGAEQRQRVGSIFQPQTDLSDVNPCIGTSQPSPGAWRQVGQPWIHMQNTQENAAEFSNVGLPSSPGQVLRRHLLRPMKSWRIIHLSTAEATLNKIGIFLFE